MIKYCVYLKKSCHLLTAVQFDLIRHYIYNNPSLELTTILPCKVNIFIESVSKCNSMQYIFSTVPNANNIINTCETSYKRSTT